jgi:hypothetical protein
VGLKKRGKKGKRGRGEKGKKSLGFLVSPVLFLVPKLLLGNVILPQALLGTSLFYAQPPKIVQIFRKEGTWQVVPKQELGNQDVTGVGRL